MDPDPDIIATKACEMFHKLPKKGKPNPANEWTTMAAIIEESESSDSNVTNNVYKVVSLGTGTKCLGQNELSALGDMVSDCHAEVVARRSFLLYLYDQITLHKSGIDDQSILKLVNPNSENDFKKNLKLKKGIKFHMFISHLPCGDASIIEQEHQKTDADDAEANSISQPSPSKKLKLEESPGQKHRTGAKLQVGPLQYEETQAIGKCRVKPGKGDPTLCMSCSDKLAKWQILGLQGALLSIFIPEPIRLQSITIGSEVPFCKESLDRAVFKRFAISELASSLHDSASPLGQFPVIRQSQHNFMKFSDTLVPAPASISWYVSPQSLVSNVQVIVGGRKQGATKKYFGKPSTMVDICRVRLYAKFKSLCIDGDDTLGRNYDDVKSKSESYTLNWKKLKESVFLGWTNKPQELKMFM